MTMKQFRKAYSLADQLAEQGGVSLEECNNALTATCGCAYEHKYCTLKQYAILINYQTLQMNGLRDVSAVDDLISYLKNITIIDQ